MCEIDDGDMIYSGFNRSDIRILDKFNIIHGKDRIQVTQYVVDRPKSIQDLINSDKKCNSKIRRLIKRK